MHRDARAWASASEELVSDTHQRGSSCTSLCSSVYIYMYIYTLELGCALAYSSGTQIEGRNLQGGEDA